MWQVGVDCLILDEKRLECRQYLIINISIIQLLLQRSVRVHFIQTVFEADTLTQQILWLVGELDCWNREMRGFTHICVDSLAEVLSHRCGH